MTVREEAQWCIRKDGMLAEIRKKIRSGKADYEDTAAYSARAGKMIGALFSRRLPEIPPEEREQLCVELLHDQYIDINAAVDAAQRYLDERLGIQLAPQHAPFDSERGHQIGSSLRDPSKPVETLQRRARAATETMTKTMHDDRMKTEAKFRSRAGLNCFITRKAVSGCCAWCTAMAGRFAYGEEPDDIYRRHDNCDCTVTFENGRKRQDVWSKREWEAPKEGAGAGERIVLTAEQARELEANAQLRALVYDMANPVKASRGKDITLHRVTTAHNALYVSDGAREMAKPKIIHQIDMRVSEAMKLMGIQDAENLPAIYVIDGVEMAKSTVAAYNAVENVLFVNIGTAVYSKDNMPDVMKAFACGEDDRSSYIHELYHWLDAEKYRKKYGIITKEKNDDYKAFAIREGKKQLDKLAINGYNIYEISPYAMTMSDAGAFDEIYTEFRTKALLVR